MWYTDFKREQHHAPFSAQQRQIGTDYRAGEDSQNLPSDFIVRILNEKYRRKMIYIRLYGHHHAVTIFLYHGSFPKKRRELCKIISSPAFSLTLYGTFIHHAPLAIYYSIAGLNPHPRSNRLRATQLISIQGISYLVNAAHTTFG